MATSGIAPSASNQVCVERRDAEHMGALGAATVRGDMPAEEGGSQAFGRHADIGRCLTQPEPCGRRMRCRRGQGLARCRADCRELAEAARAASDHLARKSAKAPKVEQGTHVFIGHGRSPLWRELKDFLQDKLDLPCDEFNRVPVAGMTNIARLGQMLDAAAFAFLVLTAEDETPSGTFHPRLNVVHEAGLFQGKLGFTRAILLLEEGCEEFSNISGLGQIRFPKGNIKAAFQEIREVLEREGLAAS